MQLCSCTENYPYPGLQLAMTGVPPEQYASALGSWAGTPHVPQLEILVSRLVSQPSSVTPLQLAYLQESQRHQANKN
jgi:hypothetical protein